MKIFGIDPGSTTTGYGIIEAQGSNVLHLDNGGIHLPKSKSLPHRLSIIYNEITALIERFQPDAVAIENVFVAKNVSSTLKLGHARGAAMVAAVNAGLSVAEYTPSQVKKAVTGYGSASKDQMQRMVKAVLNLPELAFEDASDALAVALCHCQSHAFSVALKSARR
jgi:crossover junction endodeoxyribonuclease RuvC